MVKADAATLELFGVSPASEDTRRQEGATSERLPRLDLGGQLRQRVLPLCRLGAGEIWEDPLNAHRVGVLDASSEDDIAMIANGAKAELVINDPPYNVVVGNANTTSLFRVPLDKYLRFSEKWVQNAISVMANDSHLYVWMGADYKQGFQPLPDFLLLMRGFSELKARNIITLRNQRGYGTQKNWMWVRQELLYYTRGKPPFDVNAVYTDIPKLVRGYYKNVGGRITENLERGKSKCIRAGNVWVDIQQVFYRMEENVPGCYAQKPMKAIERIVSASSSEGDLVFDFFAHSGTTLLAGEKLGRRVFTFDLDPVFAEITIRRLEHYRATGKTGWQWRSPFPELEQEDGETVWT
ncbi:MAG TPA: site-specific DNA-methyltransferase [bacterium]|nr:site-specific DNA-methyltransferase [bacterium]